MLNHIPDITDDQDEAQVKSDYPLAQSKSRQAIDNLLIEMSESEEMYLITIAQLAEQGIQQPIAISRLAKELAIQPVSANQMVHKLAEEGMLEYLPYKGAQLTTRGKQVAQQVLRHRRLWQVFLEEHLQIAASEADALACRLEHITPSDAIGRLADFLGNPTTTPEGLPIPAPIEETRPASYRTVADVQVGETCEVAQIEADPTTRSFLMSSGVHPGQVVTPVATVSSGAILLKVGENLLHLTIEISKGILVR